MTIEYAVATCTDPKCEWTDGELLADVRATEHFEETGHIVLVQITAHIGPVQNAA